MKLKFLLGSSVLALSLVACVTNPITGRSSFQVANNSELNQMALQEYQTTLSKSKIISNTTDAKKVKTVGMNIKNAAERYYKSIGREADLQGYNWEFNLLDDKQLNAWCMPGGKVAFYTGILPICKDDNGIAVVMGHEIAHAIANHSGERMSQAMALELGGQVGSILLSGKTQQTQQAFQLLYPIGSQVAVILPYSRSHELEADKMGLIFMAMAGYNPETAIPFWERMATSSGGGRPPQFLSTHPAEQARIDKIRAVLPEVMKYYKPANNNK